MKRSTAVVVSLLMFFLSYAFPKIGIVRGSGTIYIKPDGSIDGSSWKEYIVRIDNFTYVFTNNIRDNIVIERSNITVDGKNKILQGNNIGEIRSGFTWSYTNNVTIKNVNIVEWSNGISIGYSSYNSIQGCNIAENSAGIILHHSSANISENIISLNYQYGIWLDSSIGANISRNNNIANNNNGIMLEGSSSNSIHGNTISVSHSYGIYIWRSSNNSISENYINANNADGIHVCDTSNSNNISGNTITKNKIYGIFLEKSINNFLRDNVMVDNCYNFDVSGDAVLDFVNDVDPSNTVDGKPIYYWIGRKHAIVPPNAGYVILVNCSNIGVENLTPARNSRSIILSYTVNSTVIGNSMTHNGYNGIFLWYSSANKVSGNSIIDSGNGIVLLYSSENNISDNSMEDNAHSGIYVSYSSGNIISDNSLVHNVEDGLLIERSFGNCIISNSITNSSSGIHLRSSLSNNMIQNLIKANNEGIRLFQSSGNRVFANDITDNNYAVSSRWSSNNFFYHNVFDTSQILTSESANVWDDDYPSGGNYWSDYNGTDSGGDEVGDTQYIIDANNIDNYPLMGLFSSFNTSYGHAVDFVSNSSISNFSFDLSPIEVYPPEAILAFSVLGKIDTDGFIRVCIPKILINGSYVIRFDNEKITNTTYPQVRKLSCSNETHVYLYINYTHSDHTIIITGTTMIPEFPSFFILILIITATLFTVIFYKRKHALTLKRGQLHPNL